jgi:CoA:oxalate CoA-transferase
MMSSSAKSPSSRERQVLSDLRVVDLSRWIAGEFCTKFFADFGADVLKVERPGDGSLTRRWGPFPGDLPDLEASALFLHLNTNKQSVTLNLASPTGRELFLRLVKQADLVVESFRPGTLERLDIGPAVLRAINPRLVITRISAFGQSGPYRDYEATGLTLQAAGWPMNATGAADLPPHRKPGNLEQYTIGRMAAEASLAGITAARKTGQGTTIDVSGMEVLLCGADRRAPYLLTGAYSGVNAPRGIPSAHRGGATLTGIFRAKDGLVMLHVAKQVFWDRLVELVAEGDEKFRDKYLNRVVQKESPDWDEFVTYVRHWIERHTKFEVMERGQARKIPVTACMEVSEVLKTEHFRSRNCFVSGSHPVAGELEYVGAPWLMKGGWALRRTAPLLGADTVDVLAKLGVDRTAIPLLRAEGVI